MTRRNQIVDYALYSDAFYVAKGSDQNYISAFKVIELAKTYMTFNSVLDIVMDNLTLFSDVVLFSAAIPGQGCINHVN